MNYELACILSPKIADKDLDGEIDKIDKILSNNKVSNLEKSIWGKKELAYPIDKFLDGYYVQYNFELEPGGIDKIDSKLRLEEKIIRFLIIKQEPVKEEKKSEKKEKKEKKVKENKKEEKIEEVEIAKEEKPEEVKKEKKKKDIDSEKDFDKKLDEVLGKDLTD